MSNGASLDQFALLFTMAFLSTGLSLAALLTFYDQIEDRAFKSTTISVRLGMQMKQSTMEIVAIMMLV